MAKGLQQELERLATLEPDGEATRIALDSALTHRESLIVERAARHIHEHRLVSYGPALVAAWDRVRKRSDPNASAKLSIVRALSALDHPDARVFLQAVVLRQNEKVWGGSVEVAGSVRGEALMGLVGLGHSDTPQFMAEMLADDAENARSAAARSVGAWNQPDLGLALIRLRMAFPEESTDVLADLFAAWAALGGPMDWVRQKLISDAPVSVAAALALGDTRDAAHLDALVEYARREPLSDRQRAGFVAIALLRCDDGLGFLLRVVRTAHWREAITALEALEMYAHHDDMWAQVTAAASQHDDERVAKRAARMSPQAH